MISVRYHPPKRNWHFRPEPRDMRVVRDRQNVEYLHPSDEMLDWLRDNVRGGYRVKKPEAPASLGPTLLDSIDRDRFVKLPYLLPKIVIENDHEATLFKLRWS